MAGSSTTTWTPSVLLLLLPFFISFHQTSANPLFSTKHSCKETACMDVGVEEFKTNLEGLKLLKETCSRSYNLNSSLSRLPTAEKTCAFPGHFSHGVRNLLSLDLTRCNLQKDSVAVKHLEHLEGKLNSTNKCPYLVDLYCNNTNLTSASIASLEGFLENLNILLGKYQETCDL